MDNIDRQALRILRRLLEEDAVADSDAVARLCDGDPVLADRLHALLRHAQDVAEEPFAVDRNAAADPLLGKTLGPFRLEQRIGRGGMGVIYRGRREAADFAQTVAVKLIRRGFDFDDVQARFLRERQILARLDHPNLARFIDGGVAPDGRPWFALEYVQGETIERWCDRQRLSIRERVQLLVQVCTAVQYAHTQLVVHRDLKPGNILVDDAGTVRLLDFGLARLLTGDGEGDATRATVFGHTALTPEYAAPEQFTGTPGGVASDVYALGVIAYELISGVLPHNRSREHRLRAAQTGDGDMPQALSQAITRRRGNVADGDGDGTLAADDLGQRLRTRAISLIGYRRLVRGDLSRIIDTALAHEPGRRYATVAAFAEDLRRWLAGAPVQVAGNRFGYRLGKFVWRHRVVVSLATVLLLALLVASVAAVRNAWQARQQAAVALAELERSNAVRDYVMLMFRTASEGHDGASVTAREVIRNGADHLIEQFRNDPATGATTALMLAELFLLLGDNEGARPLLERIVDWPGGGIAPDVLAQARFVLAQVAYFRGDTERAQSLLTSAADWWRGQGRRYRNRLNESAVLQSQLQRATGDVAAAIRTLEQAIEERGQRLQLHDRELAIMQATLALALIQAGQHEAAYSQADAGYRLFEQMGLARSTVGLGAINNRAVAAMHLGQLERAETDFRTVAGILAELYGESPQLATMQNNLARILIRQGQVEQAATLLESALRMATAQDGEQGRSTLLPRVNLAEALATLGRLDEARPLAEAAVAIGTGSYGENSLYTALGHRARAHVRLAEHDYNGARDDLDRAQVAFSTMGAGGQDYLRSLEPLRARLPTSAR